MTRILALALVLAAVGPARAQSHPDGPPKIIIDAEDAYRRGDFERARELTPKAYELAPQPQLLFALGQIEFHLAHYREAIDYYQQFIATNPSADKVALAQQAIGAARMKLTVQEPVPEKPQPPPPLPPVAPPKPLPPPHREWDGFDTAIAITGGVGLAAGTGLLVESSRLADDRTGTLHSYDTRVNDAHLARTVGITATAAGVLVVGAAFVRWRFHLVSTTVSVDASPTHVGVALEHPL